MEPRGRAWWIDAGLLSVACLLLQRVDVEYSAHFFDHVVQHASLLHAEAGLLLAVALLGGDRRVLSTAILVNFLYWAWRVLERGFEAPYFFIISALIVLLQWRWIIACARWAGSPFGYRQRLLVSGMGRYVLCCLLLYPLGTAVLAGLLNAATHGLSVSVANVAMQQLLAKHVGVGALTLPFLLLWSDDRLRQAPVQRWAVVVAWFGLGLLVANLLEDMQVPQLRALVTLIYDYRALVGAVLGVAMLLFRVEYSMPVLVLVHLMLLHGLTGQAQRAVAPVEMLRLLMHLVECNFMALILAILFLLNRERMHRYHHVRAMCRHDASTGLDNAHALREAWRNLPASPQVLGFLLLDQVERVLGSYGWRAQMLLLREAGRTMAPLAHAYHLGGGQFVLLPREGGEGGGTATLEEILKRLQAYVFRWQGAQLRMTPYLGLAHPERLGAQTLDECLANACDAALRARREGERSALSYITTPQGEGAPEARRHRLAAAAEALACVHAGRVELYVQPIMRIDDGPAEPGFQGEVLCRLRTAEGRLLVPGEFIADLEESGHASELDIAVIERLFDWLRAHPQALPGIGRLGINLSGKSLASASFRARFAELLRHPPLPHAALCFELTETAVITGQASALRLFQELRAHGCRLALDDFGSGVQNFERLKQMPVDILKIDGQFVRNQQTQPSDQQIERAAVAVARAHGLSTVAEYVENASLVERLRALGVQWGQGYHLGRPGPIGHWLLPDEAAEVAAWLSDAGWPAR